MVHQTGTFEIGMERIDIPGTSLEASRVEPVECFRVGGDVVEELLVNEDHVAADRRDRFVARLHYFLRANESRTAARAYVMHQRRCHGRGAMVLRS